MRIVAVYIFHVEKIEADDEVDHYFDDKYNCTHHYSFRTNTAK